MSSSNQNVNDRVLGLKQNQNSNVSYSVESQKCQRNGQLFDSFQNDGMFRRESNVQMVQTSFKTERSSGSQINQKQTQQIDKQLEQMLKIFEFRNNRNKENIREQIYKLFGNNEELKNMELNSELINQIIYQFLREYQKMKEKS